MIPQSKSKIFLSEERGHLELDWFRSYHTFNFGQYRHEHKTPVGPLYLLNDDTLAGKKSVSITTEEDSDILLLPVVGTVTWQTSKGHTGEAEAGQCVQLSLPATATITISNPYEDELVNFLQWWFRSNATAHTAPQLFTFEIQLHKNTLIELPAHIGHTSAPKHFIGCFDGRAEIEYRLSDSSNTLFVFVIQGAFEVQYRLLHPKDGLALWELEKAELEALSNEAIILLSEIPVKK